MKLRTMTYALLAAVPIASLPPDLQGEPRFSVDPKDVEFKVELVGPAPLPFQAVRLRQTVRNISKKRLGPLSSVDDAAGADVKGPADTDYDWSGPACWLHPARLKFGVPRSLRASLNRDAPLILEPGEESSVSYAFAADWWKAAGPHQRPNKTCTAFFPKPGKYSLRCHYRIGEDTKIFKEIEMEVPEPQGEDKAVYEILKKKPRLASALMSRYHEPDKEIVPGLLAIIECHPKSSYADYARLALAGNLYSGAHLDKEFEDEALAAARALKQKVADKPFPYQIDALLSCRKSRLRAEPGEQQKKSVDILYRDYADALEFLDAFTISGRERPSDFDEQVDDRFMKLRTQLRVVDPEAATRMDPRDTQRELWQPFRKRPAEKNKK